MIAETPGTSGRAKEDTIVFTLPAITNIDVNTGLARLSDDSAYASKSMSADMDEIEELSGRPEKRQRIGGGMKMEIVVPKAVNPKSVYGERPAEVESETEILRRYLTKEDLESDEGYIYFTLEDFTVYTGHDYLTKENQGEGGRSFKYPYEMIRLSALNIVQRISYVLVDGFLVNEGGERHYVEKMKVDCLSVDYGDAFEEPKIWLQSTANKEIRGSGNYYRPKSLFEKARANVWYSLGKPSRTYKPYYDPFRWLARFGSHVLCFLEENAEDRDILLGDFMEFGVWLERKFEAHGNRSKVEPSYRSWLEVVESPNDFRNHVAAHKEWLWNQVYGLYNADPKLRILNLTLWKEIHTLDAIKPAYRGAHEEMTVVTPYVYEVFKEMYGEHLKKVKPFQQTPKKLLGVVIPKPIQSESPYVPQVGDVVTFYPDEENPIWKRRAAEDKEELFPKAARLMKGNWFGWVTRVLKTRVNIVWLYKPDDTILCNGGYPWKNELFFSDHCNCKDDPLFIEDILGKVDVVFRPTAEQISEAEFFVRQKYRTDDPAFHTLKASDFELGRCPCNIEETHGSYHAAKRNHKIGDTVLHTPTSKAAALLEPVVIVSFNDTEQTITVRHFKRLEALQPKAKDNELLWMDEFEDIFAQNFVRPCYIRVFDSDGAVEAPYDRRGIGDCFYIKCELRKNGTIVPLRRRLTEQELRQGFRVGEELPKPILRGMDLFCGGGNFGRGLEEGGVVQMKYAVDFDSAPLHSYRANQKDLNETKLYLGSINNYLNDAIRGNYSEEKGIPKPDEVDFISAGSPCQGFSKANRHRASDSSVRKQSLVCSLATAIDLYRPKYAVLENVREICQNRTGRDGKSENTLATMLCATVGLGYQVEAFFCDAWSHGNPQSRVRLILAITKADYTPLSRPPRSHPHKIGQVTAQMYKAPNGQSFGRREEEGLCPFRFMSVERAWSYLPDIGDGHINLPIRYPDHLSVAPHDASQRLLMAHVPRFDSRKSWRSAVDSGKLHESLWYFAQQGEKMRPDCRTYSRMERDGLCRTITTTQTPHCTRTGRWVHHDANRLITVHEARIAQGYPDDEVLVGAPKHKLHVIGNSVARGVSLALGIAVRNAYLGSSSNRSSSSPETAIVEIRDGWW